MEIMIVTIFVGICFYEIASHLTSKRQIDWIEYELRKDGTVGPDMRPMHPDDPRYGECSFKGGS